VPARSFRSLPLAATVPIGIQLAARAGPLQTTFAYHESRRLAEMLCVIDARSAGIQMKITRLFTLVGPYLPLDRHFEIGNFIGDILRGRAIDVANGGTAVRTYLYAADLATWLWRILARGETIHAYNVGSERTLSVAQAARVVAAVNGGHDEVVIRGTHSEHPLKPERYVPSTLRARSELGLAETVGLEEAIARTLAWHRANAAYTEVRRSACCTSNLALDDDTSAVDPGWQR
jgi:nucleoside-diphosphate-sugar epimerase